MYTQLYFHPVRRIYDIHLKDFLSEWLPGGRFSTEVNDHLSLTDNEVLSAIRKAVNNDHAAGHDSARRIARREHFKPVYERNPIDSQKNPRSVDAIETALINQFGPANIRRDRYSQKSRGLSFPVYSRDGRIQNSLALSKTLQQVPVFAVDLVFVNPLLRSAAAEWLEAQRDRVLSTSADAEHKDAKD
jgi:uncharacterized protein